MNISKFSVNEIVYYFMKRFPAIILGKVKGNLVRIHWGKGWKNFGDCLSPLIMRHYGLTPCYVPSYAKSDVISVGSILQDVPNDYNGYILGSGSQRADLLQFPYAKILAVRGKYSLTGGFPGDVILGDPGLLMSYVFPDFGKIKKYKLGIVLHFVDHGQEFEKAWKSKFSSDVIFINVFDSPKKVTEEIASCHFIASSSLHGLIIADSYHIPNIHIINLKTRPRDPYDQKFEDYYSAFGIEKKDDIVIDGSETELDLIEACTMKPVEEIEHVKMTLDKVHRNFADMIMKSNHL